MMPKILVIDDSLDICVLLKRFLEKNNFEVEVAHTGESGLSLLKKQSFDIIFCDYRLPDTDGLEMIPALKAINPAVEIIIITGYSDVKLAVKVMKKGAFEYVTKPIHHEEILITAKQAVKLRLEKLNQSDKKSTPSNNQKQAPKKEFVQGKGVRSQQLNKLINLVSPTDMTVVITGDSGTGKEVTAKTIHQLSKRSSKPIIAVDCGALPHELAGSVLFGHLKGSFTGALKDKVGHFEAANGGTLFLDEIGNLSYENQIKLLRVLQERKIQRIGESKSINIDVRLIAATNDNLKELVDSGKFREDLYYRLNEFSIELPSLKERQEDIEELAQFLLQNAAMELDKKVSSIDKKVLNTFEKYDWPGNIRELKNVIKRAALLCEEKTITLSSIPKEIQNPSLFRNHSIDQTDQLLKLKEVAENAEKKAIIHALKLSNFNKSKTAEILDVDRKTLYNKIKSYGIELS